MGIAGKLIESTMGGRKVAETGRVNCLLTEKLAASVSRSVKEELPGRVGVPESTPALLRVMPAGRVLVLTDQAWGALPPLPLRL